MYKGITPTITFRFPTDFDPSLASKIILTFSANEHMPPLFELSQDSMIISGNAISVALSQEQTLRRLPSGDVCCQFNFYYSDGSRVPSSVGKINLKRNLHNEVMK